MTGSVGSVEPLRYDTVRLHEPIGPFAYVVPLDFNDRRLPALSVGDPWFLASADGGAWAEPSFLCGQHAWVMRRRYSWAGSVHAKCDVQYLKPVRPGATIHVAAEVVGRYERRAGRYVVFRIETTDDGGDVVSRVQNTMLLNFREVLAARAQAAGDAAAPAPSPQSAPGPPPAPEVALAFAASPLRREDILTFFRAEEAVYGPHPNIHNDAAIARAAGLADIIAPGRYLLGLMNCMFATIYGEPWLRSGRYSVSFLANLLPGIAARVRATALSPAGAAATTPARSFSVACRDAVSGKALLSGTAGLGSTTPL